MYNAMNAHVLKLRMIAVTATLTFPRIRLSIVELTYCNIAFHVLPVGGEALQSMFSGGLASEARSSKLIFHYSTRL